MNNYYVIIIISLSFMFSNQPLWDLGVIVEKDLPITYQQEIDINNLMETNNSHDNIKALHSNNFIPPIIQEIKNPIFSKNNIIKKYDEMLSVFSLSDKILSMKKSFLNKEFSSFFNFYNVIDKNKSINDSTVDLMYIQNLYFSNQLNDAEKALEGIKAHLLSPELLLYKIKINVKLKNVVDANSNIDYFINQFPNSDLMPYVIYEKKLIKTINHD